MNYKHLHYLWMAAKHGGIVGAAQRLHLTPQTVSSQIKTLEERFGCALLRRRGRLVELTDAGRLAAEYAGKIFALGAELERELRAPRRNADVLRVGIADSIHKTIACRLLEPAVTAHAGLRVVCREGRQTALVGELAEHRLDVVLCDAPLLDSSPMRARSDKLGSTSMAVFATAALMEMHSDAFPACLARMPMLLPGSDSELKAHFDAWLVSNGLAPPIVGEFDDGALMVAFAGEGRGAIVAPSVLAASLRAQHALLPLGQIDEVRHEFYAISLDGRARHPAVGEITRAGGRTLVSFPDF
ncbi:transcriptional activator NhaR [Paraburkholderia solisilvae]|uniref:Transcriptional activator protein NhaR n=1 Tax=Paraburkholderia solisilvae TaxID=624376 RepID=A0A6J5DH02_9BURK|nr:transcriptional activator NhaR [Paraburkholderia solisilvae]CAB3753520.1 Transcriptional activator protein NhaR [Paraburkholderia solisilvae]